MTDADQLLLDWAKTQAIPWLDRRIESYNRYRDMRLPENLYRMAERIQAATVEHIRHCGPQIYAVDHTWECGCYSEYTRDDSWVIHCNVKCCHGLSTEMRLEVSPWDMPQLIQDLADMDDSHCYYDEDDDDY